MVTGVACGPLVLGNFAIFELVTGCGVCWSCKKGIKAAFIMGLLHLKLPARGQELRSWCVWLIVN